MDKLTLIQLQDLRSQYRDEGDTVSAWLVDALISRRIGVDVNQPIAYALNALHTE